MGAQEAWMGMQEVVACGYTRIMIPYQALARCRIHASMSGPALPAIPNGQLPWMVDKLQCFAATMLSQWYGWRGVFHGCGQMRPTVHVTVHCSRAEVGGSLLDF